ncbi:MAG: carbohydrate binding domain-containing protein [Bacteroidia bacterium]|nr:carbohydrate binding domain-containing protein [Bacteroidia bacterium]
MKKIYLMLAIGITTTVGAIAQSGCVKTPYDKTFKVYNPTNNIIQNSDFEKHLLHWIAAPNTTRVFTEPNPSGLSPYCAALTSWRVTHGDALLSQQVPALTPGRAYTLLATIKTKSGKNAKATLQMRFNYPGAMSTTIPLSITATGNWQVFTLNFTAPSDPNLLLTLVEVSFYRGQFDTLYIRDMDLKNNNLLENSSFDQNLAAWEVDHTDTSRATIDSGGYLNNSTKCLRLISKTNSQGDIRVIQQLPLLTQGNTYTISCYLRKKNPTPGISVTLDVRINSTNIPSAFYSATFYPTTTWQLYTYTFTVPFQMETISECFARIEFYRGQLDTVYADNIEVLNQSPGVIYSFVSKPKPEPPTGVFTENFSDPVGTPLSFDKWLVVKKSWGNYYVVQNNGVVPENIELISGQGLRLHGHGDLYSGNVMGATTDYGNGKQRVGACIATKDYFASGRYDVFAKLTPGMINAFWTFHYIEDVNFQGGAIKNTEIDFEFPASPPGNPSEIPFYTGNKHIIDDMNLNTWGGLCNGEGYHSSLRHSTPGTDLSQGFHLYTIDWHTGGNGIPPSLNWYVDNVLVKQELDSTHVGFRAARFWLGVWYASDIWMNGGDPSVMQYDDKALEVSWVQITPYHEPNDVYENETNPSTGYVTPQYPNYPTYASAPASPISATNDVMNKLGQYAIEMHVASKQIQLILAGTPNDYLTQVNIYNLNGKLIKTIELNDAHVQQTTIALNNQYEAGIYIVQAISNKGVVGCKKVPILQD